MDVRLFYEFTSFSRVVPRNAGQKSVEGTDKKKKIIEPTVFVFFHDEFVHAIAFGVLVSTRACF